MLLKLQETQSLSCHLCQQPAPSQPLDPSRGGQDWCSVWWTRHSSVSSRHGRHTRVFSHHGRVLNVASEATRAIPRCLKTGFQFGRPTTDVRARGWHSCILSTLKLSGHSATCPKDLSFVLSVFRDSSHHFLCLHTFLLILPRCQCPHHGPQQILPRQQHPLLSLPRQRHLL